METFALISWHKAAHKLNKYKTALVLLIGLVKTITEVTKVHISAQPKKENNHRGSENAKCYDRC